MKELADERQAAQQAVLSLHLTPVLYELGARPYPPRSLYQAYVAQSHIFVGIYWQQYGWVAPGMKISGLEDEFQLAGEMPRLVYIKKPAPAQDPQLGAMLQSIKDVADISYKYFSSQDELRELLQNDLALLLSERFELPGPDQDRSRAPRSSLPALPSPLLGRERELQEIEALLSRPDVRMVTLTGPGGVGKTSLALAVAAHLAPAFPDGAEWCPLAAISDPVLAVSAIAHSLDVRERSGVSLLESVKDYLQDKRLLLLLDNFEQVYSAGNLLAELLASAPGLKLLVTSRTLLRLRSEYEYPVPPLGTPDAAQSASIGDLLQNAAVRLFVERSRAVNYGFHLSDDNAGDVIEIVRRLDGLPLALELAAARSRIYGPHEILKRLGTRFQLLAGGARDLPERQRTIRDTIDWSYNLLGEDLRVLFSRLSVFTGGFTLEAAQAVCDLDKGMDVFDGIASLMDNSLLRCDASGRFHMLESIREYALDRLAERDELHGFRTRHALYFARLGANAGPYMYSSASELWLDRLETDYPNLWQALLWLQGLPDLQPLAWQLTLDLSWVWYRRGYLNEARQCFEQALEDSTRLGETILRGQLLSQAGAIAMWQSDLDSAVDLMDRGLAILRKADELLPLAYGLFTRGVLSVNRSEPGQAEPFLREALSIFEAQDNRWFQAMIHLHLGNVALSRGDPQAARTSMEESLRLGREHGDRWIVASVLNNMGEIARFRKDHDEAAPFYMESRDLFESARSFPDVARAHHSLGYVALARGDHQQASTLFKKSLELHRKLGVKRGVVEAVAGLSSALFERGEMENFVCLYGAVESHFAGLGGGLWPADRAEMQPRLEQARAQLGEAAFAAALKAGQVMQLEQAIALAAAG
jgi:predicted ATPase